MPEDPEFRAVLRAYMEWAVDDVPLSHPNDSDVPVGLKIPHWSWDGLQPPNPPLSRHERLDAVQDEVNAGQELRALDGGPAGASNAVRSRRPGDPVEPREVRSSTSSRSRPSKVHGGIGRPFAGGSGVARTALARVVGHPGLAQRVGADQPDDPELVGVGQAGPVHGLKPTLHEVSELGASGGAAIGIWVIQGWRSSMSRWIDRPNPQPGPPAVSLQDQVLRAVRAGVPHELEQLFLAGDVPVQRHRGEPELRRDPGHGDRLEALGVGDPNGGLDDGVGRQPRPGPALPRSRRPHNRSSPGGQLAGSVLLPTRHVGSRPRWSPAPIIPATSLARLP